MEGWKREWSVSERVSGRKTFWRADKVPAMEIYNKQVNRRDNANTSLIFLRSCHPPSLGASLFIHSTGVQIFIYDSASFHAGAFILQLVRLLNRYKLGGNVLGKRTNYGRKCSRSFLVESDRTSDSRECTMHVAAMAQETSLADSTRNEIIRGKLDGPPSWGNRRPLPDCRCLLPVFPYVIPPSTLTLPQSRPGNFATLAAEAEFASWGGRRVLGPSRGLKSRTTINIDNFLSGQSAIPPSFDRHNGGQVVQRMLG